MSRKIRFYSYFLLLLAGVFVGCKDELDTPNPELFSVYELNGAIDHYAQTKTSLGELDAQAQIYSNLWSENDSIAVYPNGVSEFYRFGLLEGENTSAATFRGHFPNNTSVSHLVALYPAAFAGSLSGNTLSLTLPSEQKYRTNSFGYNSYPMIAVSNSKHLSFKNLCGIIKVSVRGEGSVSSIKIKANNSSEKLSGPASVSTSFSEAPLLQMGSGGSHEVSLDCNSKIINSSLATDFYIVVPAQTYKGGITIIITSSQGVTEKVIATEVTIHRSMITYLREIETKPRYDNGKDALMSLYYATNGENWTKKTNWGTDADLSTWYGIKTNTDGTVKEIALSENNLSGSIPAEIGHLSNLSWLDLNSNQLTGSIPAEIENLMSLTHLNLYKNQLTGSIPAEIGNLSHLVHLSLHSNQLTGSIPKEVGYLSTLSRMDLGYNQLTGSIPAEIGNLSNLEHLYLNSNQFTGPIPKEVGYLSTLTRMDLGYNQLTDSIPAEIGNLRDLTELHLEENQLTGSIPAAIANIPELKFFYCDYNYLSTTIPDALKAHTYYPQWILTPQNKDPNQPLHSSTDYSYDGTVKQVLTHTIGDGVKVVITGDAFADIDYVASSTGQSHFDELVAITIEEFFKEEPYKSFKNRFDVYSVAAVSKNNVIQKGSETIFGCQYGESTHVSGSNSKVFEYARKAVGSTDIPKTLIMVIVNDHKHAGTCYLYTDNSSIAYTPFCYGSASEYGTVMRHEAGGHGFSKLMDEYENSGTIPADRITAMKNDHARGWAKNVDVTDNPTTIIWSHFISNDLYKGQVGIYEGAYHYAYGVYRPTENSIMRNNTGRFNAPSRESIYKRIMELSGESYTWEKFVEYDARNRNVSSGTAPFAVSRKETPYIPLATPVIIEGTWRDASGK